MATGEDMSWNHELETLVCQIEQEAHGMRAMHIEVSLASSRTYNWLTITGIVLGLLSGTLSGIGSVIDPGSNPIIPIISSVVSYLSSLVIAIVRFSNFEQMSESHRTAAGRYRSIELNVRSNSLLKPEPRKYTEWLTKAYEDLFVSSPLIPKDIQDKYANQAQRECIVVPRRIKPTVDVVSDNTTSDVGCVTRGDEDTLRLPDRNHYSLGRMQYEMSRMRDSTLKNSDQ